MNKEERQSPAYALEMIENLAEKMASAIIDYPELLKVDAGETENTLILSMDVASCDVENIVGNKGCTADAFRKILAVAARSSTKTVLLVISGSILV